MHKINVEEFLKTKDILFKKHFLKCFSLFFEDDTIFISQNKLISDTKLNKLIEITNKSIEGKDITFELGKKRFFNINLDIMEGVFVPQFDTEILVEQVLEFKKNFTNGIEIGLGSGAISISIMKNSNIIMKGIDINPKSIILGKRNLIKNNLEWNNQFEIGDVLSYENLNKFDFLVSNPPYIDENDVNISEWVKHNQPYESLYAKDEGLFFYKYLIDNFSFFIKEHGMMFFEIGFNQKEKIEKILKNNNSIEFYKFKKDYSSNWRCLIIKFK